MFVRLILAGGMKAGTVAEIKEGYYLIGRSAECQIRPESPSVSQRHCLLQHEGRYFRVMAVDDQSPTHVNHQPIAPKRWVLLNHGDMLQVGRIPFLVAITAEDPSLPANVTTQRAANSNTPPATQPVKQPPAAKNNNDFAERDTAEIDPPDIAPSPVQEETKSKSRWKESDKLPKKGAQD